MENVSSGCSPDYANRGTHTANEQNGSAKNEFSPQEAAAQNKHSWPRAQSALLIENFILRSSRPRREMIWGDSISQKHAGVNAAMDEFD